MIEFLKAIPNIIKEAAKSVLGVLSLMILLLFFISINFFNQEDATVKVLIFILLFLGVVLFGISMYKTTSAEQNMTVQNQPKRHAGKRKYVYLVFVLIVVIAGSLFYYILLLQTHYKYYKNFTRANTGWVGQVALTKNEASHCERYFKFIYKGRLLQEVQHLNGSGGFVLEDFDDIFTDLLVNECHAIYAVKVKFNYDKDGLLIRESFYEQADRPLVHLNYSQNSGAIKFEYNNGASCSKTNTNIKAVKLAYITNGPMKGYLEQITFCDNELDPMPNKDNIYGYRFTYYDNNKQVKQKINLNKQGNLNLYQLKYFYDSNLSLIKQEYWGESDKRYLKDGVFAINSVRNKYDDITEETYFDDADKPTYNVRGYYKKKIKYDEQGNSVEESFWGTDDKMTASTESATLVKYKYDKNGHVIESAYFNADSTPAFLVKSGAHIRRATYDNNQRRTSYSYFDQKDKPSFNMDGTHREENIYDERGYMSEQRCYGTDGNLKYGEGGAAILKIEFNDRGLHTLSYYLDENRQRVSYNNRENADPTGVGAEKIKYNDNNQPIEVFYEDINDKPIAIGGQNGGLHKIVSIYNNEGSLQEERYFNIKNELIKGFSSIRYTYDSLGRKKTQAVYDENNHPYSELDRPFLTGYVYNRENKKIEEIYLDSLQKFHYSQNYCKVKYEYDSYGRQIRIGYFNENNDAVMSSYGYSSVELRHNVKGKIIEQLLYDQNKNLMQTGCAIIRMNYNGNGYLIQTSFFDYNGHECLDNDGVAVIKSQRDRYGRITAQSYYGLNNVPVLYNKYHKVIYNRDEYGDPVFTSYQDTSLKPVLTNEGAYQKALFTRYGKIKETIAYDVNKIPAPLPGNGETIFQAFFDARGFQIARKVLDKDRHLVKNAFGIALIKETRDGEGKITLKEYFDEFQKPVNSNDGYQKTIYSYDLSLKATEKHFDINGKEVAEKK